MPDAHVLSSRSPVTRSRLAADLRALGLREGATAMVHSSMSALGWVVGGSQTVVEALVLRRAPCTRDGSRSACARRSANPGTGIVAIGRDAEPLTAHHRLDDGFGAGTPYSRIAAGGQIVLLGAPLHTISLLHHAEAIARGAKRWTTYRVPLAGRGWVEIRELDVWRGAFPYAVERPLAQIARDALAAGVGRAGAVGAARAHLFDAAELTEFAVGWLELRWPEGTRG